MFSCEKHDQAAGPYNIGKGISHDDSYTWKDRITSTRTIRRASDPEDHEGRGGKALRKAYDGGITYFDTARAYSDSEEKIGYASVMSETISIRNKTAAKTADEFWERS